MMQRFNSQNMRNERGFTLIELMIVMAISTMVTGAAIYTFMKQDKLLKNEQTSTALRAAGRNGINEIAKELRRAGYGLPRGQGLHIVYPDEIRYWANVEGVSTTLTSDMLANATTAALVGNAVDFNKASTSHWGYILLRDVQNYNRWHTLRYLSSSGSVLTTMSGTTYQPDQNFEADRGIMLSKIAYFYLDYDSANKRVTFKRDSEAAVPLVNNVKTFSFTYYDGAGTQVPVTTSLSNIYYTSTGNTYGSRTIHTIRKVRITMVLRDKDSVPTDPQEPELTFKTDVNLRNMR